MKKALSPEPQPAGSGLGSGGYLARMNHKAFQDSLSHNAYCLGLASRKVKDGRAWDARPLRPMLPQASGLGSCPDGPEDEKHKDNGAGNRTKVRPCPART